MKFSLHIRATVTAVLLTAIAIMAVPGAERASAHPEPPPGAELVIFDDIAGPYRVRISQSPERAIIGTLRVIIEPVDAETGLPVENALIRIFGTPPGDGDRQFSPGLNAPFDPSLYFGQMQLEESGVWTIDVEIDGDQGRAIAIAQTTINARARSGNNTIVGTYLFVLISATFVGVGTWLWYSSKRARRRRDAIRNQGGKPRRSSG